jgi:5-methyltetrahydropteroyltriglutamate--homocysteine methyltransferase
MMFSRDRILTTHVGSLPRDEELTDLLIRREAREAVDASSLAQAMDRSVEKILRRQFEAGIDIANDGEQQRVGFQTYIPERMSGFGGRSIRPVLRDYAEHPDLASAYRQRFPHTAKITSAPQAIGEIKYLDAAPLLEEIARFKRCAAKHGQFSGLFMTAPSPGVVSTTMLNGYYKSDDDYLSALSRELRNEYRPIAEAGLTLQIDAPDLAMERTMNFQAKTDEEFVRIAERHLEAVNEAIAGIPREHIRLHCCWGNWEGPHVHDLPMAKLLPVLYKAKVGGFSIEFANPRHQHEYEALKENPLPKDMVLFPGVVDSTTNFVEHPEVVARRILEAVDAVGERERVIASTDCGFGTFAGREWVAASIVWPKLKAMRDGADLASQRLWGKKVA